MGFKNLFLFLLLLVFFISACTQTSSPPSPETTSPAIAWLSGQPGSVNLTPTTGQEPFQCNITAGTLPPGFAFNNCVISGTAPVLADGTTKSVSPPFTITITDAAGQSQTLEYNILTIASLPEIIFNEPGICMVNQPCEVNLIAQVNGGTLPYHFQSDTFRNGAPPMGMMVDVNGVLTGTPSKTGSYTFGVCVVDVVAASICGQTQVFVEDESDDGYTSEITEGNEFVLNLVPVGSINTVYQKVFESDGAYRSRAFILGTIISSPAGIDCQDFESCNTVFPKGTLVTLTATASNGAQFTGWFGACSGTGSCSVTMDSDQEVIAIFDPGLSVNIQSVVCSPRENMIGGDLSASGSATGPVGVMLNVIPGGFSISCGSWQLDGSSCIRGPDDPLTTSWSFKNYYTSFSEDKVTADVFVTLNNPSSAPYPIEERATAESNYQC